MIFIFTARILRISKGTRSAGRRVGLFVGLACVLVLLAATGCGSLGQEYDARYGFTNPDNPLMGETLSDETFGAGTVGEKYMEDYDKKYHEEDGFSSAVPPTPIVEETK